MLGTASLIGGITGGVLLLTLPSSVFDDVVPVLILLAVALVILQPRLSRFVAERRSRVVEHGGFELWIGIFLTGVYGGYFGAAQGVILLSLLGIFIADDAAAAQRGEERARARSPTASPRCSSCSSPTWLDRRGRSSRSARWSARSSAPPSGGDCRRPRCAALIVVVGLIAAIRLLAT